MPNLTPKEHYLTLKQLRETAEKLKALRGLGDSIVIPQSLIDKYGLEAIERVLESPLKPGVSTKPNSKPENKGKE